jgi:outer membrane biogenesis lipoprotein LolB
MKKLFLSGCACLILAGCGAFHTKQPINDTYYKRHKVLLGRVNPLHLLKQVFQPPQHQTVQ